MPSVAASSHRHSAAGTGRHAEARRRRTRARPRALARILPGLLRGRTSRGGGSGGGGAPGEALDLVRRVGLAVAELRHAKRGRRAGNRQACVVDGRARRGRRAPRGVRWWERGGEGGRRFGVVVCARSPYRQAASSTWSDDDDLHGRRGEGGFPGAPVACTRAAPPHRASGEAERSATCRSTAGGGACSAADRAAPRRERRRR